MSWTHYIDSNKRYTFKCFKVYWAFRQYERDEIYKNDYEKSFTGQFIKSGYESYFVALDTKTPRFFMYKEDIIPTLNWFGVSTYQPDLILIKENKSMIMSLSGIMTRYNEKYEALFNSCSVRYIEMKINEDVIYQDWTGNLPPKEIVSMFIN